MLLTYQVCFEDRVIMVKQPWETVYGFQTMSTRGQGEKGLLGDLSGKWLEAFHSGAEYKDIIPWNVRKLPTNRQVLL